MTDKEIKTIIRAVLKEINYKPNNTYSKTESLLYGYPACKKSIEFKKTSNSKSIQGSIEHTKKYIEIVDVALDSIRQDKYFVVIPYYYFDGHTLEEVAEMSGKTTQTIYKHKRRLVNTLKNVIFADEAIKEMLEQ